MYCLVDSNPCEILTIALLYEQNLIRARMSFFDTTPTARITNWFTVDMLSVDNIVMNGPAHIVVEIFARLLLQCSLTFAYLA